MARSRWLVHALVTFVVAGCTGSAPPRPQAESTAQRVDVAPTGPAASDANDLDAAAVAAPDEAITQFRAEIEALGAGHRVHAEPVIQRIQSVGDPVGHLRALWLLGPPEEVRSAWFVEPGNQGDPPRIIELNEFPVGVRVLRARPWRNTVALLVETQGGLAQPAGLRRWIFVGEEFAEDVNVAREGLEESSEARDFADAETPWELSPPRVQRASRPACDTLLRAVIAGDDLAPWIAPEGLTVLHAYQRGITVREVMAPAQLVGPLAVRLRQTLRAVLEGQTDCPADGIPERSEQSVGAFDAAVFASTGETVRLRTVLDVVRPVATSGSARIVAANPSSDDIAQDFAAFHPGTVEHAYAAPLRIAGTAVVGMVCARNGPPGESIADHYLVVRDGEHERFWPISFGVPNERCKSAGFADLDGDGLTDVVLATQQPPQPRHRETRQQAFAGFLTPRLEDAPKLDAPTALVFSRPAPLEEALRNAVALRAMGSVDPAAACDVIQHADRRARLRSVVAPGFEIQQLTDYGIPESVTLGLPTDHWLQENGVAPADCTTLRCDPSRPYCDTGGGYMHYYFDGHRPRPRFAGVRIDGGA